VEIVIPPYVRLPLTVLCSVLGVVPAFYDKPGVAIVYAARAFGFGFSLKGQQLTLSAAGISHTLSPEGTRAVVESFSNGFEHFQEFKIWWRAVLRGDSLPPFQPKREETLSIRDLLDVH